MLYYNGIKLAKSIMFIRLSLGVGVIWLFIKGNSSGVIYSNFNKLPLILYFASNQRFWYQTCPGLLLFCKFKLRRCPLLHAKLKIPKKSAEGSRYTVENRAHEPKFNCYESPSPFFTSDSLFNSTIVLKWLIMWQYHTKYWWKHLKII